jgi:hypothetical protein
MDTSGSACRVTTAGTSGCLTSSCTQPAYNNHTTASNHRELTIPYTQGVPLIVLQSNAAVNATSDGHRLSDGEGCIIESHGGGGGIVVKYYKSKYPFRYTVKENSDGT